jgi:hypothetical protein
MNRIDPEHALKEWLHTVEPRDVPPGILEKAFAVTRRSGQRRGMAGLINAFFTSDLPLTRTNVMNRLFLPAAGIAAVVLAVVAGFAFLVGDRSPGVGGPGTTPSPMPTIAATPAPSPSPMPTIAATPAPPETATPMPTATGATEPKPLRVSDEGPVEAGTYVTEAGGKVVTFTVPDSRVAFGDKVGGGWDGSVLIQVGTPQTANLWFVGPVSNVYLDGCDWGRNSQMDPPPGPTIDDFADALASVEDREVSEPTDVEVGGHRAKYLQVTALPTGPLGGLEMCDEGLFMEIVTPTGGAGHGESAELWEVWIVDVDGDRYWIHSVYLTDTPQEQRDQLRAIVESVTFEAPR